MWLRARSTPAQSDRRRLAGARAPRTRRRDLICERVGVDNGPSRQTVPINRRPADRKRSIVQPPGDRVCCDKGVERRQPRPQAWRLIARTASAPASPTSTPTRRARFRACRGGRLSPSSPPVWRDDPIEMPVTRRRRTGQVVAPRPDRLGAKAGHAAETNEFQARPSLRSGWRPPGDRL